MDSISSYLRLELDIFLKCNFFNLMFLCFTPKAALSRKRDGTDEHSISVKMSLSEYSRHVKKCFLLFFFLRIHNIPWIALEGFNLGA